MTEEGPPVPAPELTDALDRVAVAGLWVLSPDEDHPWFEVVCVPCYSFLAVPWTPIRPVMVAGWVDTFGYQHGDHDS